MKIIISEKEIYEIKLDNDEISADEFAGLMERLRIVEKILTKSNVSDVHLHSKNKSVGRGRGKRINYPWIDNRQELIKALKINYFKDEKGRKELVEKTGQLWKDIQKNLFYCKKKANIKPKELGLKYFPSGRGHGNNYEQAKINKKDDDDND